MAAAGRKKIIGKGVGMSDKPAIDTVLLGRIITMAVFHAVLLVAFTVFMLYMVPEFAVQAENAGSPLPALARWMIGLSDFLRWHWQWAVPLLAIADAIALFAIGKAFGKRGLLVWSVIVSMIFAAAVILGTLGMLETISRMA
jgi:type II secretory pathway component PulF